MPAFLVGALWVFSDVSGALVWRLGSPSRAAVQISSISNAVPVLMHRREMGAAELGSLLTSVGQ